MADKSADVNGSDVSAVCVAIVTSLVPSDSDVTSSASEADWLSYSNTHKHTGLYITGAFFPE